MSIPVFEMSINTDTWTAIPQSGAPLELIPGIYRDRLDATDVKVLQKAESRRRLGCDENVLAVRQVAKALSTGPIVGLSVEIRHEQPVFRSGGWGRN